jgi:hypothetical protein
MPHQLRYQQGLALGMGAKPPFAPTPHLLMLTPQPHSILKRVAKAQKLCGTLVHNTILWQKAQDKNLVQNALHSSIGALDL